MTRHIPCGVTVAETGKACRLEGKPDAAGEFRCHNHRGAVDLTDAAALLAQRRAEAQVALQREAEALRAYRAVAEKQPVPTGHAHGPARQGAVSIESGGDR